MFVCYNLAMQLQAFMFMGRPGSGKGTQANLLIEKLKQVDPARGVLHIETGAEFRKFNEGTSFTAKRNKEYVDNGILVPVFMTVYVWGNSLAQRFTGNEHVVFDGTPRKLLETQMLQDAFPFYKLKPNVIYLDAHKDETTKRLVLRAQTQGRKDDSEKGIAKRHSEYDLQVQPSVDYLRKHPEMNFHDIDGIGTIEEVHSRIVKALGL